MIDLQKPRLKIFINENIKAQNLKTNRLTFNFAISTTLIAFNHFWICSQDRFHYYLIDFA